MFWSTALMFLTFYKVNTIFDLFTNVAGDTILQLLKEINLYSNTLLNNICSKYMALSF